MYVLSKIIVTFADIKVLHRTYNLELNSRREFIDIRGYSKCNGGIG